MPSMLTDVFRAHPISLSHQTHDLTSLRQLPDSFTWTHEDDLLFSAASNDQNTLPVIDLSDHAAAAAIGRACMSWGAFQVTNHGVPLSLLDDIESLTVSLFRLPAHRKMRAARPVDGVSGYGVARIASFFHKQMWSEGFTVTGSARDHFRKLWPLHHLKYCDVIKEYEEHMQKLATKLMWLVLSSLGVTEADIKWAGPNSDFNGAQAAIQLNHYPVCPEPDRAMGLAAHTDSTLLTVLYQNITAGLQVFKDGVGWLTVSPIPGSLVVNIGDLLHILSNGRLPSVLHRVRVNKNRSRFSVAYLWGPQSDVQISPIWKLVSPVEPPLYRPVTWKEYLRTKATHFNNALSVIRAHQQE
ncbi:PREDICTED: gibberellin 3-beta-dioxygenase 1-like isoform X2 [Tarenaya hassleriana]|uniref:gibberellin 3-beta-dioxygenase 1-like isoform X2 n=1 Tax=Tarenaya hassleriana TaxID=28532 RepID=UPI00053C46E0|nr:PREDICTED: gibberellin 3-beta-dioxygenase 1-like isoform X2 [Tarenaya hassleriana]